MKFLFSIPLLILTFQFAIAQDQFPSLSPKGELIQKVGKTKLHLTYERPSARGRKIFGNLVPWGKVWRTGAGLCTKISFDTPVTIGKQKIPKGSYSVFTIPNPEEWMIILNSDTTLYGSVFYDSNL